MADSATVIVDGYDARARLRELGLTVEDLTEPMQAGAAALALTVGTNYPPGFGGFSFWAEAVKVLRDLKMREGWSKSDARNYSTVVNPDRTLQIAIARGDEWTGRADAPDGSPSTLYPKGAATQLAVEANRQMSLFDQPPMPDPESADAGIATYVLLHFRQKAVIRRELSLPTSINKSGFVEGWAERIIISDIDLDPMRLSLPDEPLVEPDVFVRRRA